MSYHPIPSIFHVSAPSTDPLLLQSTYSIQSRGTPVFLPYSSETMQSPQSRGEWTKVICQCCLLITRSAYHLRYMAFGKSWQECTYKLTLSKTMSNMVLFYMLAFLAPQKAKRDSFF